MAGHDDRLTDLSPDGFAAREELARTALADATAATPVDEREQVAREAFLERLGLEVELARGRRCRSPGLGIASGLHEVRQVFDLMPTEGEQAWRNIDARLAAVPEAPRRATARTLAEEADAGQRLRRRQYAAVAGQVGAWTGRSGDGGDFFAALVAGCESTGCAPDLEQHAAAATRPSTRFGRFLQRRAAAARTRARTRAAASSYELASRYFLGAAVDLDETYAWGWRGAQAASRTRWPRPPTGSCPGASYAEAVAHLDADPARRIEGREAFRDWMQELADRTVAELADVHFDIPEPVRRIECMLAPTNDGGIYYTGPSEDFTRPGRMWWSVPDGHRHVLPLARGDHRLPRGRARPPPPGRPDRLPQRAASTAGSG